MMSPSDDEKRIVAMVDSFTKTVARNFSRNLKRAKANAEKHYSDEPVDYLLETLSHDDRYPSDHFVLYADELMKITIKKLGQYPWREGTVEGHHFQAAVYDEPSVYGINEGRISKLMVWDEAKRQGRRSYSRTTLMNYDRGWDIEPEARHKALIDELVSYLENLPPYEN